MNAISIIPIQKNNDGVRLAQINFDFKIAFAEIVWNGKKFIIFELNVLTKNSSVGSYNKGTTTYFHAIVRAIFTQAINLLFDKFSVYLHYVKPTKRA